MQKVLDMDILTPILAYMAVQGSKKVILESNPREPDLAQFSIIAYNPVHEVRFEKNKLSIDGSYIEKDPLEALYELTVKKHHADFPFIGGAIGYVGYDLLSVYEDIGEIPQDTIGTPDMHFFLYESYTVFDHKSKKVYLIEDNIYSHRTENEMKQALDKQVFALEHIDFSKVKSHQLPIFSFQPHLSKSDFETIVGTAKQLIREGDMFQCVLSQRFSSSFDGSPLDFYRQLRLTNPSNYLYFYDFDEYQIIGASPESLVSVKGSEVVTNPIAGTRPRGRDSLEDEKLSSDLLTDPKETAEHRMLVDLGRNDIGKIASAGSVRVTKYMEVEYFKYVMHLTSLVKGELRDNYHSLDALKSTLPAGTVSGAPKIRAMKRIYELEKEKRGIYAGAVGYLSASSDMDFAIAIRTMVVKDNKAYVQAGAGIVFDSIAENEYFETINKAKALTQIGEKNDFID